MNRSNSEAIGEDVGQRGLFGLNGTKTCLHADENNPVDRKKLML